MNDTLSHITIGQVALVGLILAGVVRFGGRVWSWARRAVHFVDKLEAIERQVYANGGSSMRDAVDRLEAGQAETNKRVEQVATTQGELARSHEQLVEELTQVRTVVEEHVQVSARDARRQDDPPDVDYRPAGHGGI